MTRLAGAICAWVVVGIAAYIAALSLGAYGLWITRVVVVQWGLLRAVL